MKFENSDMPLTEADIASAEAALGFELPAVVRNFYLETNGGIPELFSFHRGHVSTAVSEFFPLKSKSADTAVIAYDVIVRNRQPAPPKLLPFAMNDDGRPFFVDCSDPKGPVYLRIEDRGLTPLNVGFEEFWASLKDEE